MTPSPEKRNIGKVFGCGPRQNRVHPRTRAHAMTTADILRFINEHAPADVYGAMKRAKARTRAQLCEVLSLFPAGKELITVTAGRPAYWCGAQQNAQNPKSRAHAMSDAELATFIVERAPADVRAKMPANPTRDHLCDLLGEFDAGLELTLMQTSPPSSSSSSSGPPASAYRPRPTRQKREELKEKVEKMKETMKKLVRMKSQATDPLYEEELQERIYQIGEEIMNLTRRSPSSSSSSSSSGPGRMRRKIGPSLKSKNPKRMRTGGVYHRARTPPTGTSPVKQFPRGEYRATAMRLNRNITRQKEEAQKKQLEKLRSMRKKLVRMKSQATDPLYAEELQERIDGIDDKILHVTVIAPRRRRAMLNKMVIERGRNGFASGGSSSSSSGSGSSVSGYGSRGSPKHKVKGGNLRDRPENQTGVNYHIRHVSNKPALGYLQKAPTLDKPLKAQITDYLKRNGDEMQRLPGRALTSRAQVFTQTRWRNKKAREEYRKRDAEIRKAYEEAVKKITEIKNDKDIVVTDPVKLRALQKKMLQNLKQAKANANRGSPQKSPPRRNTNVAQRVAALKRAFEKRVGKLAVGNEKTREEYERQLQKNLENAYRGVGVQPPRKYRTKLKPATEGYYKRATRAVVPAPKKYRTGYIGNVSGGGKKRSPREKRFTKTTKRESNNRAMLYRHHGLNTEGYYKPATRAGMHPLKVKKVSGYQANVGGVNKRVNKNLINYSNVESLRRFIVSLGLLSTQMRQSSALQKRLESLLGKEVPLAAVKAAVAGINKKTHDARVRAMRKGQPRRLKSQVATTKKPTEYGSNTSMGPGSGAESGNNFSNESENEAPNKGGKKALRRIRRLVRRASPPPRYHRAPRNTTRPRHHAETYMNELTRRRLEAEKIKKNAARAASERISAMIRASRQEAARRRQNEMRRRAANLEKNHAIANAFFIEQSVKRMKGAKNWLNKKKEQASRSHRRYVQRQTTTLDPKITEMLRKREAMKPTIYNDPFLK